MPVLKGDRWFWVGSKGVSQDDERICVFRSFSGHEVTAYGAHSCAVVNGDLEFLKEFRDALDVYIQEAEK